VFLTVSAGHRYLLIRLHTAEVTGSIPAAATPIAQSGVWNWPTSPLEGVAIPESVSVSVPPGSPRLVAPGSRMISTDPGPRLGRERLIDGEIQRKPVRDENPCAAWISAVSPRLPAPLLLTSDQRLGVRGPSDVPLDAAPSTAWPMLIFPSDPLCPAVSMLHVGRGHARRSGAGSGPGRPLTVPLGSNCRRLRRGGACRPGAASIRRFAITRYGSSERRIQSRRLDADGTPCSGFWSP
jgi:hypothetical protein